jgi:hypothetical protein
MTAVAGSVFTAAQFNQYVRDNLNQTAPALATAAGQIFVATGVNAIAARTPGQSVVNTSQTTTSTSMTDLATVGPAVTATTGTAAIVFIGSSIQNSSTFNSLMGWKVTGATTLAVAFNMGGAYGTNGATISCAYYQTGLTPGSNTFTAQYEVSGGTGTFAFRQISVVPL